MTVMLPARGADVTSLKMILRTAQVHFPALLEFRHGAQRLYRRLRRQPHEPDFALLARYRFEPDDVLVDVGGNRGQSIDFNADLLSVSTHRLVRSQCAVGSSFTADVREGSEHIYRSNSLGRD